MTHRAGGGLVLLLAVLSLLVVPRMLNPPTVVGSARIEPPEPPPAVGTCLADVTGSYGVGPDGELLTDDRPRVTSCTDPHTAEVIHVMDGLAHGASASVGSDALDGVFDECWRTTGGTSSYLGLGPDSNQREPGRWEWYPDLGLSLVGPDASERAHGAAWVACVAVSSYDPLQVGLKDIVIRSGGIPPQLSACYQERPDTEGDPDFRISCSTPHRAEILGSTTFFHGSVSGMNPPSWNGILAGCTALADTATHRPGLAVDTGLAVTIVIRTMTDDELAVTIDEPPTVTADSDYAWAECLITVTDPDRQLTGSLRLIGDAPLPWA